MSGFYRQGFIFDAAVEGADAALARLRTDQMLRAVRAAAMLGNRPAPRGVWLSGQILDADDTGGDGARIIESGDAEHQSR